MKKLTTTISAILVSALLITSCNAEISTDSETATEDANQTTSDKNDAAEVAETISIEDDSYEGGEGAYLDAEIIEDNWSTIVELVKNADANTLTKQYTDFTDAVSDEEWSYIMWDATEYATTFSNVKFDELGEDNFMKQPCRVLEVFFKYEIEGLESESATIFYLKETNGNIKFIGVEMAG